MLCIHSQEAGKDELSYSTSFPLFSLFCSVWDLVRRMVPPQHIQYMSYPLSQSSLEIPLQTHPKVHPTNPIDVSYSNQVDNQSSPPYPLRFCYFWKQSLSNLWIMCVPWNWEKGSLHKGIIFEHQYFLMNIWWLLVITNWQESILLNCIEFPFHSFKKIDHFQSYCAYHNLHRFNIKNIFLIVSWR